MRFPKSSHEPRPRTRGGSAMTLRPKIPCVRAPGAASKPLSLRAVGEPLCNGLNEAVVTPVDAINELRWAKRISSDSCRPRFTSVCCQQKFVTRINVAFPKNPKATKSERPNKTNMRLEQILTQANKSIRHCKMLRPRDNRHA